MLLMNCALSIGLEKCREPGIWENLLSSPYKLSPTPGNWLRTKEIVKVKEGSVDLKCIIFSQWGSLPYSNDGNCQTPLELDPHGSVLASR